MKENETTVEFMKERGEDMSKITYASKAMFAATQAHDKQLRSNGTPYIHHPLRVGGYVGLFTNDEHIIAAAYLHDVLEDTDYQIHEFSSRTITLVEYLTKYDNESKLDHVKRVCSDEEAMLVKLCDRYDNLTEQSKKLKIYRSKKTVKESTDYLIKKAKKSENKKMFAPIVKALETIIKKG